MTVVAKSGSKALRFAVDVVLKRVQIIISVKTELITWRISVLS